MNQFEHLEYFQTDLRLVLGFLQNRNDDEKLNKFIAENESELSAIEEDAYDMISVMTHSEELSVMKTNYQTGGKVDMCKGLKDWMEKERKAGEACGEARGEARGVAMGEARFASLAERLLKESRTDDLIIATRDKEFRDTLYKEYRL